MTRVDRYMLSQFLWLFGFFALILVAIFWINRAVSLFDRLIGDGQSALVFLEFSTLALPRLIITVLPIATFAASVYVTNRLNNESELTVMMATGRSPWRLARPVLVFGLISALMMSALSHVLVPAAQARLSEREADIAQNVTARLLTEGSFLSPISGVTFYTREIGEDGVLNDVFLADRRIESQRMIYTATQAYLVRQGDQTTLIMIDGLAQRYDGRNQRLSTGKFQDFSFDISSLVRKDQSLGTNVREIGTIEMIRDSAAVAAGTSASRGEIAEELHERFARPLFCVVTALIGFATLLVGGYSRFGVWREVVVAFGLLILIDGLRGALSGAVLKDAANWFYMYIPSALGFVLAFLLLASASRPGWWKRRTAA